jgi:FixJ family two-component response regulator
MLRAIHRLLLSGGLEAQLFSDPLGFLAYAKCHSVAVAVIDIWMPGVSGLQVKKELQAISPKTRVIIITANADDLARNQAMQGGTIALFIKPFDDGEFLAAVHHGGGFGNLSVTTAVLDQSRIYNSKPSMVHYHCWGYLCISGR